MPSVNLWECLTSCDRRSRRDDLSSPSIHDELIVELGRAERLYNQEITLEPSELGWVVKIIHCDMDSSASGDGVEILIPKDCREPCKIIKDRVGIRQYNH